MSRQSQIGKRATKVYETGGYTYVKYHATDVVCFNSKQIILRTGGWYSMTTKTRMNQASNEYDLGFGIFQSKGSWYVDMYGYTIDFEDDMVLPRTKAEFEAMYLALRPAKK